jgi:hypothetical protein
MILRIDHQTTFDDLNDLSQCTTASKPNVWFIAKPLAAMTKKDGKYEI